MFIAIHLRSGDVVSGVEVADLDTPYSVSDDYVCVLCREPIRFRRGEEQYDLFTHADGVDKCFQYPTNSHIHQTGCEKAVKILCMELGCDPRSVAVEEEVTGDGVTTRADVKIEQPVPIVVEVYHRSRHGGLARRLRANLSNGYSCYVVCVADGAYDPEHTPAEFDRSLQKYGPVEVGRYTPVANTLTLGTEITADLVDVIPRHQLDDYDYILWG